MRNSVLYKKIYGCLAGGAIGDAFGAPFESRPYKTIEGKHGRIVDFIEGVHKGYPTDDTRMEHTLIKAIVKKKGRITAKELGEVWLEIPINPNHFFPDIQAAFMKIRSGLSPSLAGEGNVVTGCAIMMISPVGIVNAGDPVQAALDAKNVTCIMQPTIGSDAASVVAAAVAEAMKADATVNSVIQAAIDVALEMPLHPYRPWARTWSHVSKSTIGDAIKKAVGIARKHSDVFDVREPLYKECLGWGPVDPVEVVALTFAIIQVSGGDPKKAMIGGTNIGRDSDSIARLCGSICGALFGIDRIPKKWLRLVEKASKGNEGVRMYIDKPLSETAEEMAEAVVNNMKRLEDNVGQIKKIIS
jgi:ADP-ribosylglycohydrolase